MKKSELKEIIKEAIQEAALGPKQGKKEFHDKKDAIDFAKKELRGYRFSSGAGSEKEPFWNLKPGEYFIQIKDGKHIVGWRDK